MIANQILQNTIEGLNKITKMDVCVMNIEGKVLAGTFSEKKNVTESARIFMREPSDSRVLGEYYFLKIYEDNQPEYVFAVRGTDAHAKIVGEMAAFQLQGLLVAYEERFDKDNFFKNLILDNLLLVDIYNRAKKLHIDTDKRRVIVIIELSADKDVNVLERVRSIISSKTKDFVTAVDEKNVIIVKEVASGDGYDKLDKCAKDILESLRMEGETGLHVAYGTIVSDIKEVSKSYKEAKLALDVGRIFFREKDIIAYNTLGIGRLIYQLPIPLCKMFIREIFEGKSPDDFDEETLTTINKFFENSLNVSETSRQLYIHRNTLVYRLDKIQKTTGLDLRIFEDAITFKIALMVVKYMKYMETLEY